MKFSGWRRNFKLYGKPDFVFPKQRLAIFVDGCFWHGHDCRNTKPKTNADYWVTKINRNKNRDVQVTETLINKNWTVIRVWECELKNATRLKDKFQATITQQTYVYLLVELVLAQVDNPKFKIDPVGATAVSWNEQEWLVSNRQ